MLHDQIVSDPRRGTIIVQAMQRLCIEQNAQTGPGVSEMRDPALRIVVLPIQPLSQMPLRSCDVDRSPNTSRPPVVRSVLTSPETHDDRFENLGGRRDQVQWGFGIADALLKAGFTPLVPHLTMLWDMVSPKPYEEWLDYDRELLARCDALLRVPGYSVGATRETRFAESLRIPVIRPSSASPEDCLRAVLNWQVFG